MIFVSEVKLWGTTIGAVSLDDSQTTAVFEYDKQFISSGIEVAPLMMPLKSEPYRFPELSYKSFHGLPGLLADSLPDKFGNELINVWLSKQGRLIDSFNAIERLCYTGTRGMGALEFFPAISEANLPSEKIEVSQLVELASIVLSNRNNLKAVFDECDKRNLSSSLQQIISLGTSAGGARAKAVIALNPEAKEVRSGQYKTEKGFEHWLIKFSGVSGNKDKEEDDLSDYGMIEYTYHKMALSCGIKMTNCKLLDDGINKHFMTKRFDRDSNGKKIHMQSLAALGHFDFNIAGQTGYEQAFTILNILHMGHQDKEELFRRMIFNVAACNCDDHVKNISFLMDRTGKWSLAPAYDVCYAFNPDGDWTSSHQMTINGKRKNINKEDFDYCAKIAGLTRAQKNEAIEQVLSGVQKWKELSEENGVSSERSKAIMDCFPIL